MEIEKTKLFHIIVRLPKEDSAFLYFLLESHEGLAFYSTLPHEIGQAYRDIDMKGPIGLIDPVSHLVEQFRMDCPKAEIIKKDVIIDE